MRPHVFPPRESLTVGFAHGAYRLAAAFERRGTGIDHFQVWDADGVSRRIGEADVLVISGLWRDDLLDSGSRLVFIQSIGAGCEQFPLDRLRERGIRLAGAQGVNTNAVAEHAMAYLLAFARHLHTARDAQARRVWSGMVSDIPSREFELSGKTLLIVGLGGIGSRLATLARAFGMRVLATKWDPTRGADAADEVYGNDELSQLLPQADFVVLTCPLTPETENLINAERLASMKSRAYLVNVARGPVVNATDLLAALEEKQIAGAGLDTFHEEPLAADSPLWAMENVIVTPHTGGETQRYEENLIDILLDNLDRLSNGSESLRNQVSEPRASGSMPQ